jgi:predicted RNase H-like HicB family nuclease
MRYAIVIEKAEGNFSAYVPDLPGCVATGATIEEVESEIREAIEFHLSGMREDGTPIPLLRAGSSTSKSQRSSQ